MTIHQGFTLAEVLISLALIACSSLSLMTQQSRVAALVTEIHIKNHALIDAVNARARAG